MEGTGDANDPIRKFGERVAGSAWRSGGKIGRGKFFFSRPMLRGTGSGV
jgi:hypothetical protein